MMRRSFYNILRFFYILFDLCLTKVFGLRFRQQYIRLSYEIKTRLFPGFGSNIPDGASIKSPQDHFVWLPPPIPDWVMSEMRELGCHIDPTLYPTAVFIASSQFYSYPVIPTPGKIYEQLINLCSEEHYTHCFAIPWLKRGGADLVALKHIEFASKQPRAKVLVLLTEPGDSHWRTKIPAGVDVLEISCHANVISHEESLQVIVRLLIQLRIDVLHIINSRHVWEVVCKYGLAIRQRTRIFVSIYCDDYDKYGQPVGFARQYLFQCYKHLDKVFFDNAAYPRLLQKTYGYTQELFSILKSPVEVRSDSLHVRKPVGRRVLWAGRLDRQKRPDLLLAIARLMQDVDFYIYGDSVLESKIADIRNLRKLRNVIMKGSFDGAESLPFDEFPVFLFTSQWEGTPTIIIAAALAVIPIVASSVGGVGDIINEKSGFPVCDIENASAYVKEILYVLDNPAEAQTRAQAARRYVEVEHAQQSFESHLLNTPGYCSSTETIKEDSAA